MPKMIKPFAKPASNIAARQRVVVDISMSVFEEMVFNIMGTLSWAKMPTNAKAKKNQPKVVALTWSTSILKVWKPMIMVNWAIVSKKPVKMAVPITGLLHTVSIDIKVSE